MNRNQLLLLLVFFSFVFHNSLFSQHTDLKEYGLKGKVKSVTKYHYKLIEEKGNTYYPLHDTLWLSHNVTYYNNLGNIDSIVNRSNYRNYIPPYDSPVICTKTFYYYHKPGKKSTGIYISNTAQNRKDVMVIEWTSDYQYIEKTFDGETMKLSTQITAFLNENYRDSAGISFYFYNDELLSDSRYVTTFDNKNQIASFVETDMIAGTVDTIINEIKSYDKNGNPSKNLLYKKGSPDEKSLYIRTYEYYRD